MAIQSMQLDPNAQAYSDDEIVGKVNAATADITRVDAVAGTALGACDMDDLADGITNKAYTTTEQTKLGTIEDSATADMSGGEIQTAYEAETGAWNTTKDSKLTGVEDNATVDQTGDEIVTAIDAGASSISRSDAIDTDSLDLVKTNPVAGEYKIKSIHRQSDGKLDVEYDDVAV